MAEEKPFVKPWANWTPEQAEYIAEALLGRNDLLDGTTDEQKRRVRNNLEGYQAEHQMERTLEKNAPLLSAKGLRNQSRLVFPKANESIDANRPGWVTALEGARDLVTLPQRAGIQIGGDLKNAGRALLGFKLVDPEEYSMANAESVVANDPVVALTVHPGTAGTRLLFGARQAAASTGGKVAGKAGRAIGGFLGEGGALTGMEYAGNLGDVDYLDALLMGMGGTGLARLGSAAVTAAGKGAQKGSQYLTRKKWNINPSDSKKSNLLQREFGGERLPKENELLLLESGELGREPIAAEAVAGERSGWAKRTGETYEKVAAQQNARLEDALAFRPEVSGKPGQGVSVRNEGAPAVAKAETGNPQATEFRNSLEAVGIRPSELIVRDGETAQVALAREMNRREAYIQKAQRSIDEKAAMLGTMEPGAEREALASRLDKMQEEVNFLRSNLDRAAKLADELDLGIVSVDRLAKETADAIEAEARFSNDLSDTGFKGSTKKAAELVDDFEKTARLKDWNRDNLGNANGSGRFIPSGKLRGMVSGITKRQMKGANNDQGLLDDTKTAAMNFRRAKNRIDQEQSQGELGETANRESLRHAIFEGLWNKQPTVDNANRMTIGNLAGFVQRQPIWDKGTTKLYQFGTALVPRTADQQVARRALGLEELPGGELGGLARAVLSTAGREAPHIVQIGETDKTQKALSKVDAFVEELNRLKGEAK